MRWRLLGALFATASLMLWTSATPAAAQAGTVVAVAGSCTANGRALSLGAAVQVSDTIDVPAGGKLKLRMADGSVIAVAPGTRVAVSAYQANGGQRQNAALSLAQGLIRATVAGQPANFEVTTAVGTAVVRGTDWFIDATPGAAQVGVLSGTVDLTSAATGRSVAIPAGWGARLEAGRDPVPPRVWAQSEFAGFIQRTE